MGLQYRNRFLKISKALHWLKISCIVCGIFLVFEKSVFGQKIPGSIPIVKDTSSKKTSTSINLKAPFLDTVVWNKERYIPVTSEVNNYKKLFETLHGVQQTAYFSDAASLNEISYDIINNLYYGHLTNTNKLKPEAEVFGWHPYWIEEAYKYYPYALITHIAFFAYDVNKDGLCEDQDAIQKWKTTPMIDSAQKHHTKVLLSVTSYGQERNNAFLLNKDAWLTLGDSLLHLLRIRHAQGVDIDFMNVPKERKNDFSSFMKTLRSKLGDTCIISMHVTSKDLRSLVFDLPALKTDAKVNKFIVQGYDYEETGTQRRAMAPLFSNEHDIHCIVHTVGFCLQNGLKESDLILNLPLYGTIWYQNQSHEMTYDDIVSIYEKNYTPRVDLATESTIIEFNNQGDTIIWYESGESLYRKFLWAKIHNLAGVGLWGLGYDGGRPEVWQAISVNFAISPVQEIIPFKINNGQAYSFMLAIQKYRKMIGIGLFILLTFFITGLLLSLLDWRVREIFFRSYIYRAVLSFILLMLLLLSIYCFTGNLSSGTLVLPLISGLLVGGAVVYFITKMNLNNRKIMP